MSRTHVSSKHVLNSKKNFTSLNKIENPRKTPITRTTPFPTALRPSYCSHLHSTKPKQSLNAKSQTPISKTTSRCSLSLDTLGCLSQHGLRIDARVTDPLVLTFYEIAIIPINSKFAGVLLRCKLARPKWISLNSG